MRRLTAAEDASATPFVLSCGSSASTAPSLSTMTWWPTTSATMTTTDAGHVVRRSDQETARLGRPFENRGTPRHYRWYDQPFLRWLNATGRNVDYFSDRGLNLVPSGAALARAYDLVVFPGHHEYVTAHEYDIVTDFRNRGGNLMLLSANNFYRVDQR
jgi:hypothetical protein